MNKSVLVGAMLLALLAELPGATGLGIDTAPEALALARRNADRHGLAARARFAAGDWAADIDERFDLVVSNPPYIPSAAIAGLAREVAAHDPRLALDGGPDGLDCYRRILAEAGGLLAPSGLLALEFGEGQEEALSALARRAGLIVETVARDLAGKPRCLLATATGNGPGPGLETVGVG